LFQDFGKLLSKEIVKIPDAPDEPLHRSAVCVLPGGVIHAGPLVQLKKSGLLFWMHNPRWYQGRKKVKKLEGVGRLGARGPTKKIYHREEYFDEEGNLDYVKVTGAPACNSAS
jgi:hypothetical protein